mmetsp:Transcript_23119/g.50953  ORF Transcript_23119/g.50953 Transcript_23119/m.50953 type:complete len:247 (-) Transcript_23119:886-1626(-)
MLRGELLLKHGHIGSRRRSSLPGCLPAPGCCLDLVLNRLLLLFELLHLGMLCIQLGLHFGLLARQALNSVAGMRLLGSLLLKTCGLSLKALLEGGGICQSLLLVCLLHGQLGLLRSHLVLQRSDLLLSLGALGLLLLELGLQAVQLLLQLGNHSLALLGLSRSGGLRDLELLQLLPVAGGLALQLTKVVLVCGHLLDKLRLFFGSCLLALGSMGHILSQLLNLLHSFGILGLKHVQGFAALLLTSQ